MPLVVNKNQIRNDIILALRKCLEEKPLMNITMRDVAAKANISHSKILYYFHTKRELLRAYMEFTFESDSKVYEEFHADYLNGKIDVSSPRQYVKQFLQEVLTYLPNNLALAQINILSYYDKDLLKSTAEVDMGPSDRINEVLSTLYGKDMHETAFSLLILICGIQFFSINKEIPSDQVDRILDCLADL